MSRPSEIISGDTYSYGITSVDYPSTDGWTLKVTIMNATKIVKVTAAIDGSGYLVTLASKDTDDLTAGIYSLVESVEKGEGDALQRHTLCAYQVTVKPNIAGASAATDVRTHARKVLDAIEAVLENRATSEQQQISIAGRTLVYIPIADLLKLKDTYSRLVANETAKEKAAMGLATGRNILIAFK
jgi:hypothetical protein